VHCCGRSGLHETHQVLERIALDVELAIRPLAQQRRQIVHVGGADMTLVRPRMHGDAVGAMLQADRRRTCQRRNAQMPGVAHQRHLVQVDGQRGRFHRDCRSIIIWRVRSVRTPQW
jgi:hypothetical protein